jgi:hypothetical protein
VRGREQQQRRLDRCRCVGPSRCSSRAIHHCMESAAAELSCWHAGTTCRLAGMLIGCPHDPHIRTGGVSFLVAIATVKPQPHGRLSAADKGQCTRRSDALVDSGCAQGLCAGGARAMLLCPTQPSRAPPCTATARAVGRVRRAACERRAKAKHGAAGCGLLERLRLTWSGGVQQLLLQRVEGMHHEPARQPVRLRCCCCAAGGRVLALQPRHHLRPPPQRQQQAPTAAAASPAGSAGVRGITAATTHWGAAPSRAHTTQGS